MMKETAEEETEEVFAQPPAKDRVSFLSLKH